MSGSCRQVSSTDDGSDCTLGFVPDTPAGPSQTITYDHHLGPILIPQSWKPGAVLMAEPTKSQKTGGSTNLLKTKRISRNVGWNQCSGKLPVLSCMS